jgi:nucleoside-diphosphate-sugar epimerase
MKVLITGIHGFVGSNLTKGLKNDHQLYGLDISFPEKEGIIHTFNWNNLGEIPTVDAIIHLAGKAHDTKNTSKAEEYFEINVGLTRKIFDFFLESGAQKFIFFSSVKAVADSVDEKMLTEEMRPNPQTPYGKSKLEAENYILNQIVSADKQVYILRPAMIHGPGNKGNLNLLYQLINKGLPYPLGAFQNQRSFTSISNLTFIIEHLLKSDIQSDVYQVADNESLSTNEIVNLMAEVIGRKPRIWNLPVGLVKIMAQTGDLLKFSFNSERLRKLTENYVVSNSKLTQALQVELPISAREGLIHTLGSFQLNKVNNNSTNTSPE